MFFRLSLPDSNILKDPTHNLGQLNPCGAKWAKTNPNKTNPTPRGTGLDKSNL